MGIFASQSKQPDEVSVRRNVDTVIGAGAVFEGQLHVENSVCIEGTVRGQLSCAGRVILNKSGVIEAGVVAEYVSVNGTIIGNVEASSQLDVGETGVIEGDVVAGAITVAKGGILRGSCKMAARAQADSPGTQSHDTRSGGKAKNTPGGNGTQAPQLESVAEETRGSVPLQ